MIAHSRQSLDNRDIWQQAANALDKGVITGEEYQRIRDAYPSKLYSPNIFIRIGLFLLTTLAVACGFGLSILIAWNSNGFPLFWGLIAYGALELFIHKQSVYRAGVDDALLWCGGALVFFGIESLMHSSWTPTAISALVLVLAAWGLLRYAGLLMGLIAYGALISLIFNVITQYSHSGLAILPFVFMAVSVAAYLLFRRLAAREPLRHYRDCLSLLRVAALLSFYLSVNYYVIQNVNGSLHGESTPVALGWLWWVLTGSMPVAYIVWGIRKKDVVLLWTGLALVAGTAFTVRYYYHVLPAELAMIIAGSILIIAAYALTRYLRIPKNGFTSAAPDEPHLLENHPVEGLILAETFKALPSQPLDQSGSFGGGSGGGAGAGGTY